MRARRALVEERILVIAGKVLYPGLGLQREPFCHFLGVFFILELRTFDHTAQPRLNLFWVLKIQLDEHLPAPHLLVGHINAFNAHVYRNLLLDFRLGLHRSQRHLANRSLCLQLRKHLFRHFLDRHLQAAGRLNTPEEFRAGLSESCVR